MVAIPEPLRRVMERLEAQDRAERAAGVERARRLRALAPETGRLAASLLRAAGARRVVEVGTSGGYSTLWLAWGMAAHGGRVVTCEVDPQKVAAARANLVEAGVADRVTIAAGDARALLRDLAGPWDAAFVDAEKSDYVTYFDLLWPKLRPGGLLLADNVVSHPEELSAYLERVRSHPEALTSTVGVGKGLEVTVKFAAGETAAGE